MNGIELTKPARQQCNRLLNLVVKILQYNKITIDNSIYITVSRIEQCPILQFPLMIFSTLIIMRQKFLN